METVVINGREYTRQEVEDAMNATLEARRRIKEVVKQMVEVVISWFNKFVDFLSNPPVGLKRYFKRHKLREYERMSAGKSNNWRKHHGLPLRRKLKYK